MSTPVAFCLEQPHFDLELRESLLFGRDYAFIAGLTTVGTTPLLNVFHIFLSTVEGRVVDASMNIQLPRIIPGLYVSSPSLRFSSAEKFGLCDIEITVRVRESLQLENATTALQFALPSRFQLLISPLQNLDGFPTTSLRWYHHYPTQNLARVDIDESREVKRGDYRFRLSARLPRLSMPPVNIFFVSWCADRLCTDVLGTYPVAGFEIGDAPTLVEKEKQEKSGAWAAVFLLLAYF